MREPLPADETHTPGVHDSDNALTHDVRCGENDETRSPGVHGSREEALRRRTLAMLAERGLLAQAPDGTRRNRNRNHQHFEHTRDAQQQNVIEAEPLTIYHQPAWRAIDPERKPQALMDASARQRDLVALAHATPAAEADQCAAWVERVFLRMGLGVVTGDASALYHAWCQSSDTRCLRVGMIVAVPAHPYGAAGRSWGHVGLYLGDSRVRHCTDGRLVDAPLELWTSAYGVMAEPRWGWLGGIALGS